MKQMADKEILGRIICREWQGDRNRGSNLLRDCCADQNGISTGSFLLHGLILSGCCGFYIV